MRNFLSTIFSGLSLILAWGTHSPVFYFLAIFFGVWFLVPEFLRSIKSFHFDMHLLMGVAITGAIAIHQWSEAATVSFLFSLALSLEQWSLRRAHQAMTSLMVLAPNAANVIEPRRGEIPIESVHLNEVILIRPGERIPLDGVITSGSSYVDESMLTGESARVSKQAGDAVFAGTLNQEGALECRVTKTSDDTMLARIQKLVKEACMQRSGSEQWVDSFAKVYTPLMFIFALLVMLFPPLFFGQPWLAWIYRGLVVLVIACPCALVIATPVAIISGMTLAAARGILIKSGVYLEDIGRIQALALDKTGTLTYGKPTVQRIVPFQGHTEEELLERAVALEEGSEHPLARAIRAYHPHVQTQRATHFQAIKGKGAQAIYKGKLFWIGSHRFMHEVGQETEEIHHKALELEDAGHSVVAIGNEHHVCGLISVADAPRDGLKEVIKQLRQVGIKEMIMLTGDNEPTAHALAKMLGIKYFSQMLPEDKLNQIIELKKQWKKVAMVGDGINDAPAMAMAHLGIAMGVRGSDVILETSDITLISDDLAQLPWLMRYSRRVLAVIKQNIWFALGIKLLFVMLALSQLATLWMAIAADTGATLLVVFNAMRLLHNKS
ncbi:MAG: cadmium-translocating P-type ATPase [Verrucomicrobia bacterium]|nr:cadmium-translocating P-type ATPase [Verrucomicrobiota bacterium]MBS0646554.1 cadmium-translocating P-type ATPase [Verrucomicrobiota bacterium]